MTSDEPKKAVEPSPVEKRGTAPRVAPPKPQSTKPLGGKPAQNS